MNLINLTTRKRKQKLPKRKRLKIPRKKEKRPPAWMKSRMYWLGWLLFLVSLPFMALSVSQSIWFLAPGAILLAAAIYAHLVHRR